MKRKPPVYGGFLFVLYFLSGLTEEERHMCIKVFDKICNNAEEHLREYKRSMFNNERKQL
jgi:ribosome recycling factor